MYYYVYRITNKLLNKHYYGSRGSKIEPELDLGIKYFSSSTDKNFIKDQKLNNTNYKYKIIKTFLNRKDMIKFESLLHKKFDVRNNKNFYNKANQTETSFLVEEDTILTLNYGRISTKEFHKNREKFIHASDNKVAVLNIKTNKIDYISTEDYYNNLNKYKSLNKDKVAAYNKITKETKLVFKEELKTNLNLQHPSTDRVSVINLETNKTESITKEEWDNNPNKYKGVNYNKISGKNNPNKKLIYIYDNKGKLIHRCNGNFKQICEDNYYPHELLRRTYANKTKLYTNSEPRKEEWKQYKGWYARVIY